MTPPHWLFFPTPASAPQYIYTANTDRSVVRGTVQPAARRHTATGTESGDLVDQFAPFGSNTQYQLFNDNEIRLRFQNSDTSHSLYGSKALILSNITELKITVGLNILIAETINIAGTEARPLLKLQTTGDAAGTFWAANNLDDTDDIDITMTFTF